MQTLLSPQAFSSYRLQTDTPPNWLGSFFCQVWHNPLANRLNQQSQPIRSLECVTFRGLVGTQNTTGFGFPNMYHNFLNYGDEDKEIQLWLEITTQNS